MFIKDVNKELKAAHKSQEAEFRFPLNPAYTTDPLSYRPLSKNIKTIEKFLDQSGIPATRLIKNQM